MIDTTDNGAELPPELTALDQELSAITIEERPSFGPELEAELEREWLSPTLRAPAFRMKHAMAAAIGAVLLGAAAAPQARASIARLWSRAVGEVDSQLPVPEKPITLPPVEVVDDGTGDTGLDFRVDEPIEELGLPTLDDEARPGMEAVFPELLNREEHERLIAERYPLELRRAGIGGTVKVRLWVDVNGGVDYVQVAESSGIEALDRFALEVAGDLRLAPAMRAGVTVGTWVELPLEFDAGPREVVSEPAPIASPALPPESAIRLPDSFVPGSYVSPPPTMMEAESLLRAALDDDAAETGGAWTDKVSALLAGEPPVGSYPGRWRESAVEVLEEAMRNHPDNPAPLLALARIRRKQGLRGGARRLYEEGIRRAARRSGGEPNELLGELHYERGKLVQLEWLAWSNLGRVRPPALAGRKCDAPRGEGSEGEVQADQLIAWNFLCWEALDAVFAEGFEEVVPPEGQRREEMLRSFHAAVGNVPAHVGANVEIMLDLAERKRWSELLEASRKFVWASRGHPDALLLSGLALERLGLPDEAMARFEMALLSLPRDQVERLEDIRLLQGLDASVEPAGEEEREAFWARLDPILSTEVNERRVEHLARASYALLRFGDLDREVAKLVVRYGLPSRVRAVGGDGSLRTVFWDYGQRGPDVTFRRAVGSDHLEMTTEAKEYLDDLLESMPHRYGASDGLPVAPLAGQIATFRGHEDGIWEADVHVPMPGRLAEAEHEAELGIFVLAQDGEVLSGTRETVSAEQLRITETVRLPDEAGSVAVELRNPATRSVMRLDAPVRTGRGPSAQRISGLLMVEPARPTAQSLLRRNGWMQPVVSPIERRAELGLLFEVYDVPPGRKDLSFEVVLAGGTQGDDVRLPVRAYDEDTFASSWTWTSRRERPVTPFLVVDLSGVEPGSYSMKLLATLPGVDERAVSETGMVIR